ncbi:hypothetical protein ARMSODRAFT_1027232 [Armillaria solidipes]|uniref:Uncharacterized protein n=1 Tax=Armillaria solidipes TaxID=1076256 RepID=A0A2H3B767_9AGAR|nr:hypothetical protein ARMSODRAFT_1027232 [Armillaria solidipes]
MAWVSGTTCAMVGPCDLSSATLCLLGLTRSTQKVTIDSAWWIISSEFYVNARNAVATIALSPDSTYASPIPLR